MATHIYKRYIDDGDALSHARNYKQDWTKKSRNKKYRARKLALKNAEKLKKIPPAEILPGSLTAQIRKDSFVRRLIDTSFPHLSSIARTCNQKLRERSFVKRPGGHEDRIAASLVGTAIDYRARAYFCRDVHGSAIVERGRLFFQMRSRKGDILDRLIESFEKFIARIRPERRKLGPRTEERLCRYCILIAYLDGIGRAGFEGSAIEPLESIARPDIEKMLRRVDADVVEDVIWLSRQFYDRHAAMIGKFRKVVIGGTLAGSADVGGADFDLVVDGCLIDFKATRAAKITTQYLRQLVGYWLLDYEDALKIRAIAIVLLRHGHTEYFDIERDLRPAATIPVLRSAFRSELQRIKKST